MTTQTENKPLYYGHRERLRSRFMKDNGASMDDYEVLELLLTYSIPRRDVKPLAKQILAAYKNDLGAALHAPASELAENFKLGAGTIALFKLVTTCASRIISAAFAGGDEHILSNFDSLNAFCRNEMAYLDVEEFRAFFLDDQCRFLSQKVLSRGTINMAHVSARELVKYALEAHANLIILAHNHPNGDCKPSKADITVTRMLCDNIDIMDLQIVDHLIITKNDTYSFVAAGLMKPWRVAEAEKEKKLQKMLANDKI